MEKTTIYRVEQKDGKPVTFKGLGNMKATKRNRGYVELPDSFKNHLKELSVLALLKIIGSYNKTKSVLTIPTRGEIANLSFTNERTVRRAIKKLESIEMLTKIDNSNYLVQKGFRDVMKIPSAFLNSQNFSWGEKLMIGQLFLYMVNTGHDIKYTNSKSKQATPCGYTHTKLTELAKSLKSIGHVADGGIINIYAVVIDECEYEYERARKSELNWKLKYLTELDKNQKLEATVKKTKYISYGEEEKPTQPKDVEHI